MWNALIAVPPPGKLVGGEYKINLNGRHLNGNGRRNLH
jgi:hypothetical protein